MNFKKITRYWLIIFFVLASLQGIWAADMELKPQIERFRTDMDNLHEIMTGSKTETVDTGGAEPVKTVANAVSSIENFNPRGVWATSTAYALKDLVTESGTVYVCVEAHTSGTFSTDLSAGKWAYHQIFDQTKRLSQYGGSMTTAKSDIGSADVDLILDDDYTPTADDDIPENINLITPNGNMIHLGKYSLRDGNYEWLQSGASSEYYLIAYGGGDPGINEPKKVFENGSQIDGGTLGSLSASEWAWGNNDALPFNTLYVRLTDSTDPDSKTADYVQAGIRLSIGSLDVKSYQVFDVSGGGHVVFSKAPPVVYPNLWGAPNGTDDNDAINASIDSLGTLGKGVVGIPGSDTDYIFTAIKVRAGITLRGMGGTLKLKDNTCTDAGTNYYLISNSYGAGEWHDDVTIENLVINGNKSNNTLFNVADAITIGGNNARVQECFIFDAPDSGIMFSFAKNSTLENNRIKNGSDAGIYINDTAGSPDAYENTVINNRISGFRTGIAVKRYSSRTVISGNTIEGCGNGLTTEETDSPTSDQDTPKRLSINNNQIRTIGYDAAHSTASHIGILLRCANHSTVSGNQIEDCHKSAIHLQGASYCSISGNTITGTSSGDATDGCGIYMDKRTIGSNHYSCDYNSIKGNTVYNVNSYGFRAINNANSEDHIGNIIEGNIFHSLASHGARLDANFKNSIFKTNVCSGAAAQDITLNTAASGNLIKDNVLVNGLDNMAGADISNETAILRYKTSKWGTDESEPDSSEGSNNDIAWNRTPLAGEPLGWVKIGGAWYGFGQAGTRTNAGSPLGVVTPRGINEIVRDTTNNDFYIAYGTANTEWKKITP